MPTDPKLAAIQRFFDAYAAQDVESARAVLADDIEWHIPGHHPLAGTKRGISEVLAFFAELAKVGFQADPIFIGTNEEYAVDIHRGFSTQGTGKVDTTWALVWHFGPDGKIDRVVNLSGDQHQMDHFVWQNFPLKPIPDRLDPSG